MSSRKQLQEDETFVHCPLYNYKGVIYLKGRIEAGCSQEEGPKKGFVMGSRTQGVPLFATNFLSRVLCNWVQCIYAGNPDFVLPSRTREKRAPLLIPIVATVRILGSPALSAAALIQGELELVLRS